MAGEIVHVEFLSEDADRAQRFWEGLFGWKWFAACADSEGTASQLWQADSAAG